MKKIKKCVVCGKEFIAYHKENTCSKECRAKRGAIERQKYYYRMKAIRSGSIELDYLSDIEQLLARGAEGKLAILKKYHIIKRRDEHENGSETRIECGHSVGEVPNGDDTEALAHEGEAVAGAAKPVENH